MAKIDCYECDLCGAAIGNGREHRIQIRYPVPDSVLIPTRLDRNTRTTKSIDLCSKCFVERLPEFPAKR